MKQYYALKLIPPRPTFAQDMSEEERALMMKHIGYWTRHMEAGKVLVFGPIFDPAGAYGFGVVWGETEDEIKAFIAGDPVNGLHRYEYYPMRAMVPEAFR